MKLRPKIYGRLTRDRERDRWVITESSPNVNLELKAIFQQIDKYERDGFSFDTSLYVSNRLAWFLQMYPMAMSKEDERFLKQRKKDFAVRLESVEKIFMPSFKALDYAGLKEDCELWHYQIQFVEMFRVVKHMLLGDDYGLGKTNQAIGAMLLPGMLPAVVVVESHLQDQWKERVEEFSNLRVHIIQTMKVYELPVADVYIITYRKLSNWIEIAKTGAFKLVVYDEPQNLRTGRSTGTGQAAAIFSEKADATLGLTATPVMNYGVELWHVMSFIAPGHLGTLSEFEREWCNGKIVRDPDALGAYLRERQVLLRRTEDDVDRTLPKPNVTTHPVPFDEEAARKSDELAITLAIQSVTATDHIERGNAAMHLDTLERLRTGVAKAVGVAAYVRILLDNGLPVLLSGWHRDVYDIWLRELADYNPVMYTGSESKSQKSKSKAAFVNGDTNLMIISNRSGAGLDGLQYRCTDVVHGELDWSPMVLKQLQARLRRYGQEKIVNAHYMITNGGSDPLMVDILGVKASQAHGIMNPYTQPIIASNDNDRYRRLAEEVLKRNGIDIKDLKDQAKQQIAA